MLQFTYAHTSGTPTRVVAGVVLAHALAIGALLLSPQVPNIDTQHSLAMEMVLAPLSNTTAQVQPKAVAMPKTAAPATQPQVAPTPSHTATPQNTEIASATSATQTGRTQGAPAPSLPSSDAHGLNNPKPVYPKLSRRMNEQGQVVIRVLVATDGTPQQGDIKTSSGYDRLDQEALRTVLRWRFVPGQRLGVPEPMWFNVPVNFVLD